MLSMNHLSSAFRAAYAGVCRIFPARILLLAILVAVDTLPCAAIPPSNQWTFEVATIKPSDLKNPPPPSVDIEPDRFQAVGMTLKELIKIAWDLNYGANDQVTGGPPWVSSTRFDLDAKEDVALAAEIAKLPQHQQGVEVRAMLRDLISQRFQLQLHHETRALPVYELVVAKSGAKMMPAAGTSDKPSDQDGAARTPRQWIKFAGVGQLEGYDANMETLVTVLCMQPEIGGRMVLDKTGLNGDYDFTLKWTPDIFLNANPSANAGPSLFTALQEELGLRLDSAKAPIDRIVIDRVSLPATN